MPKNTDTQAAANYKAQLEAFGATSQGVRSLNAQQIKWDDNMVDKTIVLQYLSRKEVMGSNNKTYDVLHFRTIDGQVVAAAFGVNTSSFETVTRGDVVAVTYKGIKKMPGNRVLNIFDIQLIGHGEVE